MKLTNYTATRSTTKSKTVKQLDGSFAKREESYGVTLTFEFEDGEYLRGEEVLTREANDKAIEALDDLQTTGVDRSPVMRDEPKKEKNDGYTTSQ